MCGNEEKIVNFENEGNMNRGKRGTEDRGVRYSRGVRRLAFGAENRVQLSFRKKKKRKSGTLLL